VYIQITERMAMYGDFSPSVGVLSLTVLHPQH